MERYGTFVAEIEIGSWSKKSEIEDDSDHGSKGNMFKSSIEVGIQTHTMGLSENWMKLASPPSMAFLFMVKPI